MSVIIGLTPGRKAFERNTMRVRLGVKWNAATAKTEQSLEHPCPSMSVVLGHVGDSGEAVRTAIPFERVSTTTYPSRRGIPNQMMEEGMAVRKRKALELAHPNAAGIDIGSASHFIAVPPDRDEQPVREFKRFTEDLERAADWLIRCGVDTIALESTGVYWIPFYEILEAQGLYLATGFILRTFRSARPRAQDKTLYAYKKLICRQRPSVCKPAICKRGCPTLRHVVFRVRKEKILRTLPLLQIT